MSSIHVLRDANAKDKRIKQNNAHLWLSGDFNLIGIDWDNYSIKNKSQNTKQCRQLVDICRDNHLEQVVT